METQTNTTQGFKLNYSNVQKAFKELQEQENIKQSKEVLNTLGIEVY